LLPCLHGEIDPFNPALIDLEERAQDFVLETKQIEIEGFPNAFNPSIIRWNGALLLSFRFYKENGTTDGIGLVWLDQELNLRGEPQILNIEYNGRRYLSKQQDPRLISAKDSLFLVYNNTIDLKGYPRNRRIFLVELLYDGMTFLPQAPECLLHFTGEDPVLPEKNWVPFEYDDTLYLSYSIEPHLIFRPLFGSGSCETIAQSTSLIPWSFGILRGGTPALLSEGEYLAFFHSSLNMPSLHSKGRIVQHYFMGAYTFSASYPFALTRISPEPIVGRNFYQGKFQRTWKPLHVVFPGGWVEDGPFIWIAYGRQDHEIWIAKMDKKGLLSSLIEVEPY
jgi:predicted GH43/DUF377 family glycosyl hydrolase